MKSPNKDPESSKAFEYLKQKNVSVGIISDLNENNHLLVNDLHFLGFGYRYINHEVKYFIRQKRNRKLISQKYIFIPGIKQNDLFLLGNKRKKTMDKLSVNKYIFKEIYSTLIRMNQNYKINLKSVYEKIIPTRTDCLLAQKTGKLARVRNTELYESSWKPRVYMNKTKGRRIIATHYFNVFVSYKKIGGGNPEYPLKYFQIYPDKDLYLIYKGEKGLWNEQNIQRAINDYKNGFLSWACQRCMRRICKECSEPVLVIHGADLLADNGKNYSSGDLLCTSGLHK